MLLEVGEPPVLGRQMINQELAEYMGWTVKDHTFCNEPGVTRRMWEDPEYPGVWHPRLPSFNTDPIACTDLKAYCIRQGWCWKVSSPDGTELNFTAGIGNGYSYYTMKARTEEGAFARATLATLRVCK